LSNRARSTNQLIADGAWQRLPGYGHDTAIGIRYIDTELMIGQFINDWDLAPSEAQGVYG